MRDWTKDQKDAITASGNILVSAAAGSGKTAVLVERIIQKLIPDEAGNFTDIDRLLVVTFARDAAAEMKSRIKDALTKLLLEEKTPEGKKHYKRQQRLLVHADITTIDAFCIRLVRENFHLLGIDPKFGILQDPAEIEILKEETARELFETLYEEEENSFFLRLADMFASGADDWALLYKVLTLYQFTRALPEPETWLHACAENYGRPFCKSIWKQRIERKRQEVLKKCLQLLDDALKAAIWSILGEEVENIDGWVEILPESERAQLYEYWEDGFFRRMMEERELLKTMPAMDWDAFAQSLRGHLVHIRIPTGKKEKIEIKKYVIQLRNEMDPYLDQLRELYALEEGQLDEIFPRLYKTMKDMEKLVGLFSQRYSEVKTKRSLYEFNDLEHLCLRLLREFPEIAKACREQYHEILMDEYQDTNGLQEAIFSCIAGPDNRFMVGDMKQSIYRFRQSDPAIFKEKDSVYSKGKGGRRILLRENFRSRRQVLDSVNDIFSSIMYEQTGEIDYDESQRLICGNKSYGDLEHPDCDYTSELYIIEDRKKDDAETDSETEGIEDLEKERLEARFVAGKIRELMERGFRVLDGGKYRPLRCSDIAILSSSVKNTGHIYIEELARAGFDAVAESTGYFERSEIKLMINFIKIINNPYQDIPLVAVLRSPVFRFTEDELAKIRLQAGGCFYQALKKSREDQKCRAFLEKLETWRAYAKYMPADRLIWTLYMETSFYDMSAVLYGGEEAQANLRMLFEKARVYEASGFKGLFHFIRFLERIQESGSDISGANLIGGNEAVIRIMTIHKSKGLEFPVIFVTGAGKRMNRMAGQGDFALHKDLGIGMTYYEPERRMKSDTVIKKLIRWTQQDEAAAEDMRKLYVALTRPKEKLIVTGVIDAGRTGRGGETIGGMQERMRQWREMKKSGGRYDAYDICRPGAAFLDWVAPEAISAGRLDTGAGTASIGGNWRVSGITFDTIMENAVPADGQTAPEALENDAVFAQVKALLESCYHYEDAKDLPTKLSVSQVKRLFGRYQGENEADLQVDDKFSNDEFLYMEPLKKRPAFLKAKKITGAELGTAYHSVFADIHIKEGMSLAYIEEEIRRMAEDGILTEEEASQIEPEKILEFFTSRLGRELVDSEYYREAPFEICVPADAFYHDGRQEEILLQGIIDCYFETRDHKLILFDYKTDRCENGQELIDQYQVQLFWYRQAAQKLLGRPIDKVYIYSVYLGQEFLIDF